MRKLSILPALAAVLLLAPACGSDSDSDSADPTSETTEAESSDTEPSAPATTADGGGSAESAMITLAELRFEPSEATIGVGETVTWTNTDAFAHTVTSADGSSVEYDSGEIGEGASFEQTFDAAGTYDFFCQIHPSMQGTIIVEE